MSEGLADWLRAQLDEDERSAQGAQASWKRGPMLARHADASVGDVLHAADHVSAWTPARVLLEAASKRAILNLHASTEAWIYTPDGQPWAIGDVVLGADPDATDPKALVDLSTPTTVCKDCSGTYPCQTIRLLAQPYRGRDGWWDEWGTE